MQNSSLFLGKKSNALGFQKLLMIFNKNEKKFKFSYFNLSSNI